MAEQNDVVYGDTFQVRFVWGHRRRYPRYPLQTPIEFMIVGEAAQSGSKGAEAHGEGSDISLGGLGVRVPEDSANMPPIGARVRLQMMIEGLNEPAKIEGVVVHASAQSKFGISFMNLTADLRKRIKRLLTSRIAA